MVVRVGGRIPIRHPGRCEMGKWDKLSWRGVQGNMLLFLERFSSPLPLMEKCKNDSRDENRPLRRTGGSIFTRRLAPHMPEVWVVFFAIRLQKLFPVVIKS